MSSVSLYQVDAKTEAEIVADVLFVHGVGGNYLDTWHPPGKAEDFWPSWLSADIENVRVFSLGYPASVTMWSSNSSSMGILERSRNILEYLTAHGIGARPTIFIAHSLGGLMVKQLLQTADTMNIEKWRPLVSNTRAIVFLATPHTGASLSDLASRLSFLSLPSNVTKEMAHGSAYLQNLGEWFRQNVARMSITVAAYHETSKTGPTVVVDSVSANPGIVGCVPIGVDGNHLSICKPLERNDLVYQSVSKLVRETVSAFLRPNKPVRVFLVPGYTDLFSKIKDALVAQDIWIDIQFVEEDATRLSLGVSNNGLMRDDKCYLFFIDIDERDPESIVDLIQLARSHGRGNTYKPIFILITAAGSLAEGLSRMPAFARPALARYFNFSGFISADNLSDRLSNLRLRIESEWSIRPRSSGGIL
ncbi:hypothetical protein PS862_05027 [Pseudomonas fluorescens]|uniref:DUF676 domain-containing protein n=1 Tax=Pseudomonas fluorescens TaxID=294 RepID=A0A5E7P1V8_PSEFL|nr:hypothetical protein [Pseudomonas fluorescens]VVP43815.1 hypothetical protein PS862_05027 [Pseudomonas fluorescens]